MPWSISDVDSHKKGLSSTQKRQWVRIANSTLKKCKEKGGSNCEGRAIRQANGVVGNVVNSNQSVVQINNYDIRFEQHQGRQHLVVPVVMMVEGVHHGSHGPLFHSAEELGKYPGAWNGIPVSVDHPEMDGENVSANSPDIIDSSVVGRIYNSYMDGNKLKGEAWLDSEKLREVSPESYTYIAQRKPLEVSLGVFTDEDDDEGDWNGEHYIGVARNHRPDHLALLPQAVGACSWEDGCGVRINKEGGDGKIEDIKTLSKQLTEKGYSVVQMNELGMIGLSRALHEKLDIMDTDTRVHYLEEVYDDYIIYRVSTRPMDGGSSISRLYKREYTTNQDDSVELTGEPVSVVKKVSYEETANSNKNRKEAKNMSQNNDCQCKQKVDSLIANELSTLQETDREWLENTDEQYIDKMINMQSSLELKAKEADSKQDEPNGNQGKSDDKQNITQEEAMNVLKEQLSDPDKFMGLLPQDVRDQVQHGMKLHRDHRNGMIQAILNNTQVYTKEELEAIPTEGLDKLSQAIKIPRDYSAQASGKPQKNQESEIEPLLPTEV